MAKTEDLRMLALDSLLEMQKNETPCHIYIRNVLEAHGYLSVREKNFYRRLTEGTLENRIKLDHVIDIFAKTKTKKMKPMIREILRMGTYQILYMNSVPDRAAVNESVKLAQKRGFYSLKGFVNGILRSISREKDRISFPGRENFTEYISVNYSIPEFLAERWIREFGPEKTEIMAKAFLEVPPLSVRIRRNQSQVIKEMENAGITVVKGPWLPYAFILKGASSVAELEPFRRGDITVQDVSSMLAVEAAGIREGMNILDLCAAPGGKTILAADMLNGTGQVISRDLTESKTMLIGENLMRCGTSNVRVEVRDAAIPDEELFGWADVVIADQPCSGLGVIGRKPDIKYYADQRRIDALSALQKDILKNAVRYLKKDGVLIYSTCTVTEEENLHNVQWIKENLPVRAGDLTEYMPEKLRKEPSLKEGYLQLLPGVYPCDGFFISRFILKNG